MNPTPPSTHVHACIEPEDSDVCATNGECRCECGATMPAMSGDDWEMPFTISDEGAHLVAEYGVASFDYGQARLGPNDILPELQRRTEARSALKAYIAQLETAAAYQKTLARTAASQARNYQALYQEAKPSSPPPPSPPEEGPGPRLSVEMQRDLARAMGYNIPATPSSPDLK